MVILLKIFFLYMGITLETNADNKNQHRLIGVESPLKLNKKNMIQLKTRL